MNEVIKNRKSEIEQELIVMLIGGDDSFAVQSRKQHILKHIVPEMFDDVLYQNIIKAANKLAKDEFPITLDYFLAKARKTKTLILLEKAAILQRLNEEFITNANCDYYIKLFQELYFDEQFSKNSTYEEFKTLEKLKEKIELKNNTFQIADGAINIISDYYKNWDKAVLSGWNSLDKRVGAYLPGDFVILAGAPGAGKTCTMLNIVQKMEKRGRKVLLFSLEMKRQQLQNRIISAKTGVASSKIRLFNLEPDEVKKYVNYSDSDEFKNSNILVCDDFEMTLSDIEGTIRKTAPDVVFVDYLGLIKPTVKGSEYEQMNEISRGLKKLAGNLQVPVFALHQLSRKIFERDNKEPMMSDLRGSGHLEQDADFVFFVHRPAYFDPKLNPHEFKFIVGKSRHTGGGKYFTLSYDAKTQTITDPAGDTPEPYQQLDFKGVKNAEIIKNSQ